MNNLAPSGALVAAFGALALSAGSAQPTGGAALLIIHCDADAATPLTLEIAARDGHLVRSLDAAGPLAHATLPPGVYHLSARIGAARRGDTLALLEASRVDLHMRLGAVGPGRRLLQLTHRSEPPAKQA